ncbi:hypothetical protein HPB47_022443 [Ixodes persulcatus]|uniref:Uncharacterized protein n=1 Tax=Ixodes persulcatus TaxID=34615 RepID=A0AC60QD08_IXOPE|nr:hypothetical protein HPB47_022443 [Ixodes persulcatus]
MPVRQVTLGDHGRRPVNLRRKERAASEALLRSRMHDRLQDPVLFCQWDRNIPKGDTHLQENSAVCALHFDERPSAAKTPLTPRSDSIQAFRGASWRQNSLPVPRAGRRSTHPTL